MTDNGNNSKLQTDPIGGGSSLETKTIGGWRFLSAAEVLNAEYPEMPWLVDKVIPLNGLALLTSKPKVGKSTLARCLAVAVAQGRPWLGKETTQGPVLYCCLEESEPFVKAHLNQLGLKETDPLRVHYPDREIKKAATVQDLAECVERYCPRLIVVDPLMFLLKAPDLNDYASTNRALRPFHKMARESEASVLLVHHNNKREMVSPGDEILGSTSIFGICDVALLMGDDKRRGRTLYSKPRYGEAIDTVELVLGADGWVTVGRDVRELNAKDLDNEIIEFLTGRGQTDTKTIREAVKRQDNIVKARLRSMAKDGILDCTGAGRKGKPRLYSVPSIHPSEGTATEPETQSETFPYMEPDYARPL